jgi:iron complex transport system substrate-binding protein
MSGAREKSERQRIVSLVPSASAILYALGAQRDIVGVSRWCRHVAPVGRRAQVGDCWKLDMGEVTRLRPTLLIGSVPFAPETVAQILKEPIPFVALNPRSLRDIENDIRILGRLTDRKAAAEKIIGKMQRGFSAIARRAAATGRTRRKPVVYCEAWPNPRISSPPWVAEMVEIAGGKNAVTCGARVTDEDVAAAKPDVIVLAWTAAKDRSNPAKTLRNPLWQDVPAVKNRRVVVISDELLNTPGPPLLRGGEKLFDAIQCDGAGNEQA